MTAKRGHWARQIEFLLTLLGFAVGLGNIWRFPYMCLRNGGGAFLIPYTVASLFIGIPLFYLEVFIGQFSGKSASSAWSISPLFKGIGWSMVVIMYVCSLFYGHVVAFVIYYLGVSFSPELPWVSCNNSWNTENCFGGSTNTTWNGTQGLSNQNFTVDANSTNMTDFYGERKLVSPAEEYLQYNVLALSDDIGNLGGIQWKVLVCHLVGWTLVSLCLISGIQSIGKVAYLTSTAPYVLLTVLLVRGCLLPGSLQGIIYYVRPQWSKLLEFRIWVEAALQVFYSVGAFCGGNLALASYNKFHNNFQRDAIFVSVMDGLTSFYGGFAIFSVIGYMAHEAGIPVDKVITSGPGLAFVVYPEALSKLPLPQLWSVLFFLTLALLGIGTQFGHLQAVNSGLQDGFSFLKGKERLILLGHTLSVALIGLIFCTQAGMYWFQLFDWYGSVFSITVNAMLGSIAVAWIYGLNQLFQDIALMRGARPHFIYKILLGGISPICIIICFFYFATGFTEPTYGDYRYPGWAIGIGWTVALMSMLQIPIWATIGLLEQKGNLLQRLKTLCKPGESWGPQLPELRATYRSLIHRTINENDEEETEHEESKL